MPKKSGGRVRIKQMGPKGGASAAALNPMADLAIPPEEMIHLPPKQDSKTTHFYPMTQTFTMDYSKFSAIYPTYLDSKKSVKHGRRLGVSDSVDTPTVEDISVVLQACNIRHVIQPFKGYPRDMDSRWYNPGRVLVDMDDQVGLKLGIALIDKNDGSIENEDDDDVPELDMDEDGNIPITKKQLCRELAKRIPKLPSRIRRLVEEKKREEEERKKAKEAERKKSIAASSKGGGGGGGSGSNKKKGKKKR